MRRDYFTLDAAGVQVDDSERPTMRITYEGPTEEFESRLRREGTLLSGDGIDITFRLQGDLDSDRPKGVLAIADRVTGEYVLELNAEAETVFAVTATVAEGDENGVYRVELETSDGAELVSYEKSTLLIYDHEGDLLRERSLIPSGVEI